MQLIDQTAFWKNQIMDSMKNSLALEINSWLSKHTFFSWLIHHPVISLLVGLILVVLAIRLFLTVYRIVATAIDRMWMGILRSPFVLMKFLFGWEVKPKNSTPSSIITNYEVTSNPQQLQDILACLEHIQSQQQQIIQDIETLKKQSHHDNIKKLNLQLPGKKVSPVSEP